MLVLVPLTLAGCDTPKKVSRRAWARDTMLEHMYLGSNWARVWQLKCKEDVFLGPLGGVRSILFGSIRENKILVNLCFWLGLLIWKSRMLLLELTLVRNQLHHLNNKRKPHHPSLKKEHHPHNLTKTNKPKS